MVHQKPFEIAFIFFGFYGKSKQLFVYYVHAEERGGHMGIIEVENLTKDYGFKRGVFGISFKIKKGEAYGFLGPNGQEDDRDQASDWLFKTGQREGTDLRTRFL